MRRRLRAFRKDRRGAVAVITTLMLMVLMAASAMAVDVGSVFVASRKLQGMADLAALAAASNLSDAAAAAQSTASSNGWDGPVNATTTTGQYQGLSSIPVSQRFTAGGSPNAAQVTLSANADLFFSPLLLGQSTWRITRSATAAQAAVASFSIGSGLLTVQNGAANAILSALTGSQVSLTAVDYNNLASANVDLLSYAQALQTRLSLQGASFNNVLSANVSTGTALQVLAQVLQSQNPAAATAIGALASAAGNSTPANLSQLMNLGPYGQQDHGLNSSGAAIQIDALDLADAMLMLAQGGHELQLNLNQSLPGISQVTAWLAIGQRPSNSPWIAVDDAGNTVVYTVQARLYLDVKVLSGSPVLSALGVTGIDLPILVDAASAEAKLASLNCASSGNSASLSVLTSVGHVSIASIDPSTLNNFTQPVAESPDTMIGVPLVTVTGQARVNVGGQTWQTVPFSQSDVTNQTVKTVSTNDIAQSTASSLLNNLSVNVSLAGLGFGIGQGPVTSALASALSGVTPELDSLLNGLTSILGVSLGTADVRMDGIRCGQPALVA